MWRSNVTRPEPAAAPLVPWLRALQRWLAACAPVHAIGASARRRHLFDSHHARSLAQLPEPSLAACRVGPSASGRVTTRAQRTRRTTATRVTRWPIRASARGESQPCLFSTHRTARLLQSPHRSRACPTLWRRTLNSRSRSHPQAHPIWRERRSRGASTPKPTRRLVRSNACTSRRERAASCSRLSTLLGRLVRHSLLQTDADLVRLADARSGQRRHCRRGHGRGRARDHRPAVDARSARRATSTGRRRSALGSRPASVRPARRWRRQSSGRLIVRRPAARRVLTGQRCAASSADGRDPQ